MPIAVTAAATASLLAMGVACGGCATTSAVAAPAVAQAPPPNAFAAAQAAFRARVEAYLAVRRTATDRTPEVSETGDPAKITSRQQQVGRAIAAARAGAKPGDLFADDIAPYLRHIVAADFAARTAADRAALAEDLPPGAQVTINAPYPTDLPLLSVPAKLLGQLPTLPEAVEYRLLRRQLILRDRDANLVIDILPAGPSRAPR